MSRHPAFIVPALIASAVLLSACGHRKQAADGSQPPARAERADKATKAAEADRAAAERADKAAAEGQPTEVRGTPAPGSKFAQLRMGMTTKDVIKLIGKPDDTLSYITGKGMYWSLGSDTARYEYVYAGAGRLTFSAKGGFSTQATLFRIIHNADEPAKRTGPPPPEAKS